MTSVVDIVTKEQVDAAWSDYEKIARKVAANPTVLCDRPHMEEFNRAHQRWSRLFLRFDALAHSTHANEGRNG